MLLLENDIYIYVCVCVNFTRGSSKMEDACDLYGRAANMFKMAKNWSGKDIHSAST